MTSHSKKSVSMAQPIRLPGKPVNSFQFNQCANGFIVTVGAHAALSPRRVFWRHIEEDSYNEFVAPEIGDYLQVLSCVDSAEAYLIFRNGDASGRLQLYRISLPQGIAVPCPDVRESDAREVYVLELVLARGKDLYAITGARPVPIPSTGYKVEFRFCRINVETGQFDVISYLQSPYA
jgi:hypothetical protein